MKRTLILGYGNPDREDDGVSWHILTRLAARIGQTAPASLEEDFDPPGKEVDLVFVLQLAPDLAQDFCCYDRICFVDAHTGAIPDDLHVEKLQPGFQNSPFTHHMTPETLLSILQTLFKAEPEGLLVSVRGYQFEFANTLSERTDALADQAVERILEWL